MKVLYHHRTQGRGGEGVHIREIVTALSHHGHEVTVISPPGVDPLAGAHEASAPAARRPEAVTVRDAARRVLGWCSRRAPQPVFELLELGYNAYALARIGAALRAKKYDAIYERYAFLCVAGALLARWLRIPLILEVNEISGIQRNRAQTFTRLTSWLERRVLDRASAVMVVSSFLAKELTARGADADRIHVIPNAVDPGAFDPDTDCGAVRRQYGLEDRFCIGFLGHFAGWDRLDRLISAVKRLRAASRDVHLLLVGDGAARPDLERQVRAEGLEESVTFTGVVPRDRVPALIRAFDVCVLPHSNAFGSPLVLFEFMAMGRAVMVPDVGPVLDVIVHGENGYVFRNGDVDQIVAGVQHLMDHPEERARLGRRARRAIEERHTWRANGRRVSELLRLAQKEGPERC